MNKKRPRNLKELKEKLLDYFEVDANGCHNFSGLIDRGYGKVKFQYKTFFAHRLYYELFKGPIEDNLLVCHKCDNPACVNIDHLFLGTFLDNNMDKINKGRDHNKSKTHCKHGHEFTKDNTYVDKKLNNKRKCKTCDRLRHRKSYLETGVMDDE